MNTKMFYSPETGGFYAPSINPTIPEDAIEISALDHKALLAGQASGKRIGFDGKKPVLVDKVVTAAQQATTQIAILEASITSGDLRRAVLGDLTALDKLTDVEAQVAALQGS